MWTYWIPGTAVSSDIWLMAITSGAVHDQNRCQLLRPRGGAGQTRCMKLTFGNGLLPIGRRAAPGTSAIAITLASLIIKQHCNLPRQTLAAARGGSSPLTGRSIWCIHGRTANCNMLVDAMDQTRIRDTYKICETGALAAPLRRFGHFRHQRLWSS